MEAVLKVPVVVKNNLALSFCDELKSEQYLSMPIGEYLKKLDQKGLYGGRFRHSFSLRPDLPVGYYEDLFPIYVSELTAKNPITLNLKFLTGKSISIKVDLFYEVKKLKLLIQEKEGIPSDQNRIVYKGMQLQDDQNLADYGVSDGVTMHVIMRLRGGGCLPTLFVDVSNENSFIDSEFSDSAPDWRIVRNGLNLEGFCRNSKCAAIDQRVICPVPCTVFDLIGEKQLVECPMCRERVKPIMCGFTNCSYTFEGTKVENNSLVKFQQDSPVWVGNHYRHYDPEVSGVAEWKSLKIITKFRGSLEGLSTFCFLCLRQKKPENSDEFVTANCGHIYHEECRKQFSLDLKDSCLICSKKL